MTSRPTCSTFTALNLKCPTAFCKGSLQEHFLVKEFSPLCLTRQPNPFRISISFHISINHQHRFGQNNSRIHCVTGEKHGKKPFYIQRGELWAHFRPTAGEFYFLSVEFERILLVFFFHDDKMTVFCKWSFGGSGKERRGGCFLVEMKGSDSEKHLCRDPILVMLSDTRNNNMSLRGKKTNKKKQGLLVVLHGRASEMKLLPLNTTE